MKKMIKNIIDKIVEFFKNVIGKVVEFFKNVISKVVEFFKSQTRETNINPGSCYASSYGGALAGNSLQIS